MLGPETDATLRYHDLGPLLVDRDGRPLALAGRRLTAALSLLLMNANQRVSVDALIDALWEDTPPADPESTLQSHLFRLRKLLEPDHSRSRPYAVILHEAAGYRLVAPPTHIDSLVLAEAAGEARDLILDDQPKRALTRCTEALRLWRGRPWTPHTDETWAHATSARLEELYAQLRGRRIDALLALGDPHQALADLDLLVAEHGLRERFWAQRMLASYRLGRTEDALAAYQRARRLLGSEVGVEPGPELRALQARILDGDPTLAGPQPEPTRQVLALGAASPEPPAPSGHEPVVRLPVRRSPMLGRDQELAELSRLLGLERLTTVVGPAGVGKNRLVVEAARAAAAGFPDGVWFVDLTSATDDRMLVQTVASSIGLDMGESQSALDALLAYARTRRMLLVLANGSHLVDPVGDLADGLIDDVESETCLAVTMREPLGVEGERVWGLRPLSISGLIDDDHADLDALAAHPAVALFVQRAAASGAGVAPGDLPAVAQICAAVDGLPLAIELAAAQLRSFSLSEIADQVRADSSTLARVGRRGPTTLADTIESSVSTLPASDQRVHRSIAVLPGPFTAAAATAATGLPGAVVRNAVSGLVHRSLLVPLGARLPGTSSRFAQLAPIRSHARGSSTAVAIGEAEARRDDWVLALAAEMPRMGHPSERAWFLRIDDDLAAVRAMLQHCLVDEPQAAGGFVVPRLGLYWYYRAMVVEWQQWAGMAVAAATTQPFDRLLAGVSLACAISLAGRSDLAPPYLDAVDEFAPESLDHDQLIMLGEFLFGLANTARATRDLVVGHRCADRLRGLAGRTGDEVLDLFAEIAQLATDIIQGDPDETLARTAVAYDRAMDLTNDYAAWSVATLGAMACLQSGQPEKGLRWSDRTLGHYVVQGVGEAAGPLTLRGGLLALSGQSFEAAKVLAAARAQARRGGQRWPRTMETWKLVALADAQLSQAERDRAHAEGSRLRLVDLPLEHFHG